MAAYIGGDKVEKLLAVPEGQWHTVAETLEAVVKFSSGKELCQTILKNMKRYIYIYIQVYLYKFLFQEWWGSHMHDIAANQIDERAKQVVVQLFTKPQVINLQVIKEHAAECEQDCLSLPGVSSLDTRRQVQRKRIFISLFL